MKQSVCLLRQASGQKNLQVDAIMDAVIVQGAVRIRSSRAALALFFRPFQIGSLQYH